MASHPFFATITPVLCISHDQHNEAFHRLASEQRRAIKMRAFASMARELGRAHAGEVAVLVQVEPGFSLVKPRPRDPLPAGVQHLEDHLRRINLARGRRPPLELDGTGPVTGICKTVGPVHEDVFVVKLLRSGRPHAIEVESLRVEVGLQFHFAFPIEAILPGPNP